MPPAIIAAIIGAAATIGVTAYEHTSAPGPNAGQPTPAQLQTNAITQATQQRTAAGQEASQLVPGLQADTSGGLSPDATTNLSYLFSGNGQFAPQGPQFGSSGAQTSFGGATPGLNFGSPSSGAGGATSGSGSDIASLVQRFLSGGGATGDSGSIFNNPAGGANPTNYFSPGLVG